MGRTSKLPTMRLILLVLCGLAFCRTRSDAATNALFKGRTGTTTTTTNGGSSRDQAPHVSSAASSLSRESSSLAAATATAGDLIPTSPEEDDDAAADETPGPPPPPPPEKVTGRGEEGGVSQEGGEGGDSQEAAAATRAAAAISGGNNSDGGGGGGSNNSDEDDNNNNNNSTLQRDFQPNDGPAADVLPDEDADAGVDSPAAGAGGGASSSGSAAAAAAALAARAKSKAAEAWGRLEVGVERAIHVRREVKAVFSSELERCLLKATRPENIAVDEDCMLALLTQANRLAAVKACCDCDPHEVVCSKLRKKIMEQDWRTVVKALYVVHRLQRDSPAKEAARFSAFMKDQWAEGAGELGKHMRTDGGVYAPWLKVYCGYLATRGLRLEAATNAFRSWETLTSTRQLRNVSLFADILRCMCPRVGVAGPLAPPSLCFWPFPAMRSNASEDVVRFCAFFGPLVLGHAANFP
ncbi:unnamed protein product, partial [Ectocarpus sp. 8 AP-2014]